MSNLKKIEWSNSRKCIDEIFPANYNPRKITDEQAAQLKTSLDKFQLADPIIINTDNKIIGGHQRYYILKQSGETQVDVRVPDRALTDDEERELNLRLNKNTGEWNLDLLKDFDKDLLADVGFTSAELDAIFPIEASEQDDVVPEPPEEPITQRGDIWQLGRHRVMCGDSTLVDDVERLMDGGKADMVFTDPPYGVDYEGGHFHSGDVNIVRKREKLVADNVDIYKELCPILYSYCDGPIYLWFADSRGRLVYNAIEESGLEIHALIIWHKINATYAAMNAQYKQRHEPCLYCKPKGKNLRWHGASTESTIWEIKKEGRNNLHPTQKPVALAEKAIRNHSVNLILDLFLGSGSTLIACEKTNRICYGMEIDPKYCDVIVKRWEDYTGQKAQRLCETLTK